MEIVITSEVVSSLYVVFDCLQELALMHARRLELVKRDNNADAIEAASLDGIGASLGGPVIDDESRREMLILTITSAARQAVDDIISINQELPLLEYMLKVGPRAPGPADGASTDSRMRQPPSDDPSIDPTRKGLVRATVYWCIQAGM
jgi:hypothetical protein